MKKISICVLCVFITILYSCKKKEEKPKSNIITEIDSIYPNMSKESKFAKYPKSDSLAKLSLNELLKMYTKRDTSALVMTKIDSLIVGEVVRRHEINSDLYAAYRDEFWGQNKKYVLTLDTAQLKLKLDKTQDTDYVQFNFTDYKGATDIDYVIVKTHTFKSFASCFPVLLLKEMLKDPDFRKIQVGKGIKELTIPPATNSTKYDIAMLKYFDINGNVQYFDISEDPRIN